MKVTISFCANRTEDGRTFLETFGWMDDDWASVRDNNHARDLLLQLIEDTSIKDEKPDFGKLTPLFEVYLFVTDVTRANKGLASYRADYRKYAGCPASVIDSGMLVYTTIKHTIRKTWKESKCS